MKIVKIEVIEGKVLTVDKRKLAPVMLTLKNFWSTKKIKAYPTPSGPTFGGPSILYFDYCDELGQDLDTEYEYGFSKQINNFLTNQEF